MRRKNFRFFLLILSPIILNLLLGANVSSAQDVPAPEKHLGFEVGTDHKLATYDQALEYFKAIEQASPRMKVFEMGKTSMGKPMIYAVITSEDNMVKLARYQEISKKLARVKGLNDAGARLLAAEGRAVVWIDVGIHASECAPTQHALQLAYDLVTADDAETRLIRENTILLLVFANPDGMQMLAEWYQPNVGTPYEVSPMPWLYHKYAGHDNNRDSYMNNLVETRNITRIVNQEWFPVIFHDHHQTAPFPARIWIPPAAEPTNPNLHPLFIRGKNLIGAAMGYAFDREEKPGAISRFVFDFIYPGYEDSFCDFFNVISIMTETAHYRYATPRLYSVDEFPEQYRDFTIGAFYPSPWMGGWWRLRDGVEYCLTASKAVLHTAAVYREMFLYGKYKMGRDTISRFQKEAPYAWIIPQLQWDSPVAARMLDNLVFSGINVYKAEEPFVSDGISFPAGTWIIPMNQPFARFVKAIFEEQVYPDLAKYPILWQGIVRPQNFPNAYLPPYDMAGWTLPHQMGVEVFTAEAPLEVDMAPLKKVVPPAGGVKGNAGYAYLISPKTNNCFIAANRIMKQGGQLLRAKESFTINGRSHPPGTMIVLSNSVSRAFMESLAHELFLAIDGIGSLATKNTYKIKAPRIGLYKSWTASIDEGWTRWLLEQYEFPFTNVNNAEIKAGKLRERFDVLIIPSMSSNAIVNGHEKGTIPPTYVGGIAGDGVRNLVEFIEGGGTLVALGQGCPFAIDMLGLPVEDALKDLQPRGRRLYAQAGDTKPPIPRFACPGSVIKMEFNPSHPVALGMPEKAPGMFYRSTAFNIESTFGEKQPEVIARYPGEKLLISGYLKGEEYLQRKAAAVDVPQGKGRVILLGFAVQNRAQPHGTFKLLFNSLYYGAAK